MESWEIPNAEFVKKHGLTSRDRQVPEPDVTVEMEAGKVYSCADLPSIDIAEGVTASVCWGRGTLLEWLKMAPNTAYPEQAMTGELITAAQSGSATCTLDGQALDLGSNSLLYLTEPMRRSLQAGPDGFEAMEVFSPVLVDHLALAGTVLPDEADVTFPDQGIDKSSLEPGRVYGFGDIPRKPIRLPGQDPDVTPSAYTTLMWGKNFMLSFISMDGNASFPNHFHPEDQLMMALGGSMKEGIIGDWRPMSGDRKDVILQPGGMVHAAQISPDGVNVVDVFWPVRPDYLSILK